MKIVWEPLIPLGWLPVLLILGAILLYASTAAIFREAGPRTGSLSLLLRLASLLMVMVLVFRPAISIPQPNPEAYEVRILLDQSGSMGTEDAPGGLSRLDWGTQSIASFFEDNPEFPWQIARFSEYPETFSQWIQKPVRAEGETRMERALEFALRNQDSVRIPAAVWLFSDGRQENSGAVKETFLRWSQEGIPVTVVGIGKDEEPPRREIHWEEPENSAIIQGEWVTRELKISNPLSEELSGVLEVREVGGALIDQSSLVIPPGETLSHPISWKPSISGTRWLQARWTGSDPDDSLVVDPLRQDVEEQEGLRVLFIGKSPSWEWKFLRRAVDDQPVYQFGSVWALGGNRIALNTFDGERRILEVEDNWPLEGDWVEEADVILLDAGAAQYLSLELQEMIQNHVSRRGGGLILTGDATLLDASWRPILPVRSWTSRAVSAGTPIMYAVAPVFQEVSDGLLFQAPFPEWAESDSVPMVGESKPTTIPLLKVDDDRVLWALHAYGAGRVLQAPRMFTWHWALSGGSQLRKQRVFWRELLWWLGANLRPRVEWPSWPDQVQADAMHTLPLKVLGQDFKALGPGDVQLQVQELDSGVVSRIPLLSDPMVPSRLLADWEAPSGGGWYNFTVQTTGQDGEALSESRLLPVFSSSMELKDVRRDERLLRDLARVTGGRYQRAEDGPLESPVLRKDIPSREARFPLWDNLWVLLAFILFLVTEIALRRRHGYS